MSVLLGARRDAASAGAAFDVVCPEGPAHRVLALLGLLPAFGLAVATN